MGFSFRLNPAQIALPFILLVSGIIIEITIAGSFIAYFLSASGLGERLSLRAQAAAHAGVQDAIVRITRDKEYASGGASYSLSIDGDSAFITIFSSSRSWKQACLKKSWTSF